MNNISIILFANRLSGSGLGQQVISSILPRSDIHVVQLPEEPYSWKELGYDKLHNENLRIAVCGGDGTVNWVVSMLSEYYGHDTDSFRPPLAIIPMGTGNDLSNMLGWGQAFDFFDLVDIDDRLDEIRRVKDVKNVDIWSVSAKKLKSKEPAKTKTMINYFSIGVDANIAKDFADARNSFPELFFCHTASRLMYVPVTFGSLIGQNTLETYLKGSMEVDGQTIPFNFTDSSKTFIVQAITSIYGGLDLWKSPEERAVDDGKFEIIEQGGFWSLAFSQIGVNLSDGIGQAQSVTLTTSETAVYQIDGEPMVAEGPHKFTVTRIGSYPMLFA